MIKDDLFEVKKMLVKNNDLCIFLECQRTAISLLVLLKSRLNLSLKFTNPIKSVLFVII